LGAHNHANVNDSSANQTSSSFGIATEPYPARAINLGLKLAFSGLGRRLFGALEI
jgi:hypothetical protein